MLFCSCVIVADLAFYADATLRLGLALPCFGRTCLAYTGQGTAAYNINIEEMIAPPIRRLGCVRAFHDVRSPCRKTGPRCLPSVTFTPSGPLVYRWQIGSQHCTRSLIF